jgi:hypothetical protein
MFLLPIIMIAGYVACLHIFEARLNNDKLDLLYLEIGIILGVIGLLFIFRNFFKAIKNTRLFIKIYTNSIIYDYLTEKGEFKTFTLQKNDIKSVKW